MDRRIEAAKIRNAVLLAVAALIWGIAIVAQSVAMDYIGPFTYNGIRSLIGGIVLIPVILISDANKKKRGEFMLAQIQAMFAVVDLGKINWNQFLEKYLEIAMTKLLFFIASIVTLGIIVASCISILSSAFQRILKPLAILPFSSITVALASGTHEAERVTTSYIKTFFGFCISGAFMVICVKLGTALTNGGLIAFDFANLSTNEKLLYISVQNMITPIVIAGLVKTADSVIGRFL